MSHRPEGISEFYLTPLNYKRNENVWHKKSPMGVNMLSQVVKKLFKEGGIDGFLSNRSLKRSTRTILANDGYGRDLVIKKTGHLSESDIDYLEMNRQMEINMSDSINFCKTKTCSEDKTAPKEDTSSERKPCIVIEKNDFKVNIYL